MKKSKKTYLSTVALSLALGIIVVASFAPLIGTNSMEGSCERLSLAALKPFQWVDADAPCALYFFKAIMSYCFLSFFILTIEGLQRLLGEKNPSTGVQFLKGAIAFGVYAACLLWVVHTSVGLSFTLSLFALSGALVYFVPIMAFMWGLKFLSTHKVFIFAAALFAVYVALIAISFLL